MFWQLLRLRLQWLYFPLPNVPPVRPMLWKWLGSEDQWNNLSICQECRLSLLIKTPFLPLMDQAIVDFLPRRRRMSCQNNWLSCGLNGIYLMPKILPELRFRLVHPQELRLNVPRAQKRIIFVLKLWLVRYFFAQIAFFTWFSHRVTFCHYSPHRLVSAHIPEQQMKLPLHVRCAFQELSEQGRLSCLQSFFLHSCPPGPPTWGPPRPARLCTPCWFFKS